jgi:hypothetical protein
LRLPGRRVPIVQQFLRIFLDIVLWRRGPQDLPASGLLVGITLAAYVLVGAVQLALLDEPGAMWLVFLVADPALLTASVWLLLRLYGHAERFQQTAAAVLGTGALLGFAVFLPLQLLVTGLGFDPASPFAQGAALFLVVTFALVTGRILKLATGSSLFTGIAAALTYFMAINALVGALQGTGS